MSPARPAPACRVMGILNATPDSFSDGGLVPSDPEGRIRTLVAEGADILDIGGESTRPGHAEVSAEEELRRVLPVIAAARRIARDVRISVDTRKAVVARAALEAGADMVNDVSGLSDPDMAAVVADAGCDVVLMRYAPIEGSIVDGCRQQLDAIVARAVAAGIARDRIIVDPGLGFGDPPGGSVEANLRLVREVRDYAQGLPVLIGASRKRFIGTMTGEAVPSRRVGGSVAVALLAAWAGARIVRVHDVAATKQALAVWDHARTLGPWMPVGVDEAFGGRAPT